MPCKRRFKVKSKAQQRFGFAAAKRGEIKKSSARKAAKRGAAFKRLPSRKR